MLMNVEIAPNKPELEILIVEDHDSLRQMMAEHLRGCGLGVREADSLVTLNQALLQSVPHLLLLDLNLHDADGLDLIQGLRQTHPDIGVVVITGRGRATDRERSYVQGADVFLKKPFDLAELMAVVQTLGRRVKFGPSPAQQAPLLLHIDRCQLQVPGGAVVTIRDVDVKLLQVLAQAPATGLALQDILRSLDVKNPMEKDQFRLRLQVHRLRSKLAADPVMADLIHSVHGLGYRLSQPLRVVKTPASPSFPPPPPLSRG